MTTPFPRTVSRNRYECQKKTARYSILVSDSIDKTVVPCKQSCVATSVVGKMVAARKTNDANREIISYSALTEVERKNKIISS